MPRRGFIIALVALATAFSAHRPLAAQSAHEAEEVLVRAMRPTPSGEEVDRYEDAMARLREPALRDTDPAAPPPQATRLDEDEYP